MLANERSAFVKNFSDALLVFRTRRLLKPAHDRAAANFNQRDAELRLIILQARTELYTRENNAPPINLKEIMNGNLIPTDPFTDQPFQFKDGQPYSQGPEEAMEK